MKNALVWVLAAMVSSGGVLLAQEEPQAPKQYVVRSGTDIPLVLVYSVSMRTSRVGGVFSSRLHLRFTWTA